MHVVEEEHVAQGDAQVMQLLKDWYVVATHFLKHSPIYNMYFMQIEPSMFF